MRHLSTPAQGLLLVLFLAACTGAPAATPTVGPGATSPAATPPEATQVPAVPTATPAAVGGHECDAIPTFSLENPEPSFPPDTALLSAFPQQIGGQPVTEVTTFSFAALLCLFGGQAAVDEFRSELQGGLDIALLSMGTAEVTIDDESISLVAFRLAGRSGTEIIASFAQLAAIAAGESGEPEAEFSTQTVGGKSVTVVTDQDGDVTYLYVVGDILWALSDVTPEQAATILAGLP
jgi:hypothetical protein